MYVEEIYIENNGAIENLHLVARKNGELPAPIVLAGLNGSGKTNFLSLVVDAIFEHAATYYTDVATHMDAGRRAYFRLVGGASIRAGKNGSVVIIKMTDENDVISHVEKAGVVTVDEAKNRIPQSLSGFSQWQENGSYKISPAPDGVAKRVFENGAYVYFPSSRSEIPYWMNDDNSIEFNINRKIDRTLNKPIVVERGISKLKQWLLGLLLDTRVDVTLHQSAGGLVFFPIKVDVNVLNNQLLWNGMNAILREILNAPAARLVYFGRGSSEIGFANGIDQTELSLDSLSAGQATLFNIFGTLMRYGDGTTGDLPSEPRAIKGICIVDEIDAHMHIDLQRRALPRLIAMFPKVQFIISSHSPFFLLGMKHKFPSEQSHIIEMPTGIEIDGEAYSEFDHAFSVLTETQKFRDAVVSQISQGEKLIVLVEGETDEPYIRAAIHALGRTELSDLMEIAWIGAKDKISGEGFNTGKSSLHAALSFLRANPEFLKRKVCLLFDNDAKKSDLDDGLLYVRSIPSIFANGVINDGVENLLPKDVFTDDVYDTKENSKGNGTKTTVTSVNKMRLCKKVCENEKREDFLGFSSILNALELLAK